MQAFENHRQPVSFQWMVDCVTKRTLLKPDSRLFYRPQPVQTVPGAAQLVGTSARCLRVSEHN